MRLNSMLRVSRTRATLWPTASRPHPPWRRLLPRNLCRKPPNQSQGPQPQSRRRTPPGCRQWSTSRPGSRSRWRYRDQSLHHSPRRGRPGGLCFRTEGVRIAFATDLGYIPPNVKAQLKGVDLLLLESNHDLEMLRDGPYPWSVKQRVLSRVGHLSNEAAAAFLRRVRRAGSLCDLAHLSQSNNLPELARVTAERALNGRASLLANRLLLAAQHEALPPIYF